MTKTFDFTAYQEADLFDGHITRGTSFVKEAATIEITATDNDSRLSGDRGDHPTDRSFQTATISRDGEALGNDGAIYAERGFILRGDDGKHYRVVEIEQEGSDANYYTFFGQQPEDGVELTVLRAVNIFGGLKYDWLDAGEVASGEPELENIVSIAAGSDDFNILVKALAAADLVETVQGLSDITVFAPTDAAFTQLAVDLGFTGDTSDEDAVFGAIAATLTELGGGDPIPLLTDILLYHVSAGAKSAAQIDALDAVPTLLEGATFGSEGSDLIDNEPDVANPNIVIPDIAASNGTVQAIDRVLIPLDIPGNTAPEPEPEPDLPTLTGIVAASGGTFDADNTDFDLLLTAVQAAGLAGALDDPEADLTVFAPNDAAFIGLAQALGFEGNDEGAAFGFIVDALTLLGGGDPIPLLTDVLLYHVAPGARDAEAVLSSTTIPTLLGVDLGVNGTMLVDQDPDVADPSIIATDIAAANGIAHVIDGVLLPADLLASDGSNGVDFVIGDDDAQSVQTGRDNDLVSGKGGDDCISTGNGDDVALGGAGDDDIFGGAGNDTLSGDAGDDLLIGSAGDDVLDGGAGQDELNGGMGANTLTGGEGNDSFVFLTKGGAATITDFTQGEDQINLRSFGFHSIEEIADGISTGVSGAVITLTDTEITLAGIEASALSDADFIF